MASKLKVGDIVHCTFLDHSENSKDVMNFEVFGRLVSITQASYTIIAWGYVDPTDRARDNNDDNEVWFSIVRKAVKDIRALK